MLADTQLLPTRPALVTALPPVIQLRSPTLPLTASRLGREDGEGGLRPSSARTAVGLLRPSQQPPWPRPRLREERPPPPRAATGCPSEAPRLVVPPVLRVRAPLLGLHVAEAGALLIPEGVRLPSPRPVEARVRDGVRVIRHYFFR